MYRSISLRTWCTYEARRFELTFLDESTFLRGVYISQTKYEASISMDDLWHGGERGGKQPTHVGDRIFVRQDPSPSPRKR